MYADARPTTNGSGYATLPVTKAPDWHALIAWDMLFNNLSTGLFLVAALGELAAPADFTSVAQAAYPTALALLLLDVLCLVLDLGDPCRFHHMLRVFKPSSPMSLGTWSLTVYSLPLTVIVATELLPRDWVALVWIRLLAIVIGLLPALASAVYKGVLISTTAQPGWRDARWLGGYLTSSALLLGCAEMLGLSILMGQDHAAGILRPALAVLLVFNLVTLALLVVDVRATLAQIYPPGPLLGVGALCLGGGLLLPLCLLLVGTNPVLHFGVVLVLLLGSLAIRYVIVKVPHAMS